MNESSESRAGWRRARWILVIIACLATLIALFYAEEDWRGKRDWENCKAELEVKGEVLDWNAYIPAPVPDDQNFFKAPKMQEWFVRPDWHHPWPTNELTGLSTNGLTTAVITNETGAVNYMKWSDPFAPQFDLIREAIKRPYARMDGDYSRPFEAPVPNFVAARALAQVLAQRTKCYLLLDRPQMALDELTLLNDSRRLLEGAPTGKPILLVSAMINVAITGLYVDTIAKGLQSHAWQEPQLAALQEQLKEINLLSILLQGLKCEPAASCRELETIPSPKMSEWFSYGWTISLWQKIINLKWLLMPRGWIYQNMVTVARLEFKEQGEFDLANNLIQPSVAEKLNREIENSSSHDSPFTFLAAIAIPNSVKATQTTAHHQTLVNEARIACALERYHLAHGEYPDALDALMPQFIEKIPHDIIGGEPLHYRRKDDGKFLLYSIGWNETNDGGQVVLAKDGSVDREKGDWVWQSPQK